ncbi:MarR family transcriptional regulator [Candidatus Aminicenantes bacterium AC-708-M15]|jgi:DNA-binding Lrp family transcriptional regulator|nr:MarR family transcriptional regulator [SCandidatus Aminicenantes bacterium Aminicenantia_JdfR_composite]MCP2604133.1 MarR family transcriptional regulator [Candidatus Aminicenantes bacterium AC-708-M15]MCP2606270.1 MarR family transcriptional regulator [Candidatus Aminicenantes bacterium AC-708-I09]MCP2617960.1 MarR family transcriptional regulator [Candidatus Aminicenantes bacterium AC-335-A11]
MSDKQKIILETMKKAGKPLRPGDIAKLTGMDSKEISQIIKELKKEGKIISPKRCFYAPAEK